MDAPPGREDEEKDFLLSVLTFAEETNCQQCARYDGPLGGTRVGMNLFYTDLLAKLWLLLDVERSAPVMRVPGFISQARLPPSAYWKEQYSKARGRIWFGPREEAMTRSADDSELRFQHVATRVFAASSDPDHPEYTETAPSEDNRRAIGWWERHYADVADYEQEYHLQNQIMKWSGITGFFYSKGLAPYLQQVPVDRTEEFGRWYARARPGLKYTLPLAVDGGAGQECMALLGTETSRYYGGVSLSGMKLLRVPTLSTGVPASLRLTNAVASVPKLAAGNRLGRALPVLERSTLIKVDPLPGLTQARVGSIQMALGTVELSHVRSALGYQLVLGTKAAPMGSFTSSVAAQAVHLSWHPGQIARAPELVQRITSGTEAVPVSVGVFRESASKIAAAPGRSWPSPLHVQESYDVLVPDAVGNGYSRMRLSNAPDAHAAPAKLSSVLESYRYQRYSMDRAASGLPTSQGVARTATNVGPGPGAQKIQIQGLEWFPEGLTLVTDGKALFVPKPSGAAAQAKWYALDRSAPLTQRELNEIWNASLKGERTVRLTGSRAEQAARAIAGGDQVQARSLIEGLSKDLGPERGPQLVREHLEAAGDFQLTRGDPTEASHLYKLAQELGDAPPDVLIRRTVADLSAGKSGPNALEQVLERHAARLPYEERVATYKTMQGLEQDMPDVAVLTGVKLGAQDLVPPEVVPLVRLERDGPDVLLALRRDRPLGGEAVAKGDLGRVIPEDASVYVEDGFSFNKNDFQLNPAMNVSELGNNPAVEVVRIREMGTGNFRPGKVYVKDGKGGGDRAYRRASGPIVREKTGGDIFFIQLRDPDKCDKDEDGELSAEERRDCQVP
ncbi:MAG TPA: hypothetical protein VFB81_13105 [Myxococcales bacterium]|nr:hypothetical protein [Myxococcales bacterium]